MRVTVLGSGAAFPRPGGACSGYLVQTDEVAVWLDAGNGSFANLQKVVAFPEVDALVVSHRHGDHMADMLPFMYARALDCVDLGPVPVYCPEEVRGALVAGHGSGTMELMASAFEFTGCAGPFEVGDLRFEPFQTVHPVQTFGFRVIHGGRTLVYTSDTAEFPELAKACQGADLLLAEATYVRGMQAPPFMHLWAPQTGELAAKAEVRQLAVTHVWATSPLSQAVREAAESYDGPIDCAMEGCVFDV